MYKVGDEVFVKGNVVEVMDAVPYPTRVQFGEGETAYVFSNDEVCYADKIVKTYEMGLNDAWELAKKILYGNDEQLIEIFGSCIDKIYFDLTCKREIINCYTPQEALAKIEAYEKEKEIKVNNIVKVKGESGFGIVTAVCSGLAYILWKDGSSGDYELSELESTGRMAEGLDLLLRQIAE